MEVKFTAGFAKRNQIQFIHTLARVAALMAFLAFSQGCSDGTGVGTAASAGNGSTASVVQPSDVAIVSGNGQTGTVGMTLSQPLAVKVTNGAGAGVAGLNVVWAVKDGGGTLSATSTVTNSSGVASVTGWTLGTAAGANVASATVSGLQAAVFTAEGKPDEPASLFVSPPEIDAKVGETEILEATVLDGHGNLIAEGITWSSTDLGVATVTGDGVVTALTAGTTTITASAGGLSASSIINVSTGTPMGILRVKGQSQKGPAGKSLSKPIVVEVRDAAGLPIPSVNVDWAVTQGAGSIEPLSNLSDPLPSGVQLSSQRNVTNQTNGSGQAGVVWVLGPSQGTNTLTASVEGAGSAVFVATSEAGEPASVTVSPSAASLMEGESRDLYATVLDESGNQVSTSVAWSSSNPTAVSVDPYSGYVTANSVGSSVITAVAGDAQGAAAISVIELAPAELLSMSGNGQEGMVGESLPSPLVVEVRDGSGSPISGVTVEWAVTAGDGSMNVSNSNTDGSGRAEVLWTLGTVSGLNQATAVVSGLTPVSFSATGNPGAASLVTVSPDVMSVSVEESAQLGAAAWDAHGNPVTTSVSWASTAPSVVTVDAAGVATGEAPGTATIEAAAGDAKGIAEVIVATGTPASLTKVSGDGQTGSVGATLSSALAIRVEDSAGEPLAGIGVQWAVTQGGGSVARTSGITDASGEAQMDWTLGTETGTGEVTATVSGLTPVTFSSTAVAGPVAEIVVSPDQATVVAGNTVTFTAEAADAFGNPVDASFTWDSSDENVAMIGSSSGLALGIATGTVVITALSGGASGSAILAVESVPVPAAVTDLAVTGTTDVSAGITFTEVNDGLDQPASYELRYYQGTGDWSSALRVNSGSCAGVFEGTGIGNTLTCSVDGLAPLTTYTFLVRSQRVESDVVILGQVSNAAEGTTAEADLTVPASAVMVSGDTQTGTVGTTLSAPLTLEVRNSNGTPLEGVTVAWAVKAGGGSLNATSTVTNSAGQSQVQWTLGTTPGEGKVSATVSDAVVSEFTSTAKAGAVASITLTPDPASVKVEGNIAFSATGKDEYGNLVSPTYSWSSVDTTVIIPVDPPGTFYGVSTGNTTVKASANGVTGTASVNVEAKTYPSIRIVSGNNQSGDPGSTLPLYLVVEYRNSQGEPTSGFPVEWSVTQGGGTLSDSVTTTDSRGEARVSWTLGPNAGTNKATANVDGVGTVVFEASGAEDQQSSGLHPNEPTDMSTIMSADGSTAELNGHAFGETQFGKWYGHTGGGGHNVDVVDDLNNPTGSGKAVRFKWDSEKNEAAIADLIFSKPWKTVYIMHRVIVESGWADFGHKWFYFLPDGMTVPGQAVWTSQEPWGALRVIDGNDAVPISSGSGTLDDRDRELAIEYLFVAESSPHAGDGQVFVWLNGELVGSSSTLSMAHDATTYAAAWKRIHYYNKANSVPSTSYHRVRELYISGRDY